MTVGAATPNCCRFISLIIFLLLPYQVSAADKLLGIHSARTMSQSMPWIAEEAGLFKKYDLEFQLVYASSASMVNAAMLSGSGDVAITDHAQRCPGGSNLFDNLFVPRPIQHHHDHVLHPFLQCARDDGECLGDRRLKLQRIAAFLHVLNHPRAVR